MVNRKERKRKKLQRQKQRLREKRLQQDRDQFLQFAVLQHTVSVEHVRASHTLVLLRGLPGSGKSSLAAALARCYPNAVTCSADLYFMHGSEYRYDVEKLQDAHKCCQEKAVEAIERKVNVLIVDNSNVRAWETKFYSSLAQRNGYRLLVLEPRTPWARDPEQLAARNSHNVTADVIRKKLGSWQPLVPLFYGWFLNAVDSVSLRERAMQCISEVMRLQGVAKHYSSLLSDGDSLTNASDWSGLFRSSSQLLHCTAAFLGGRRAVSALSYHDQVAAQVGRVHSLCVIGWCVTPRTLSARLRLTRPQRRCYRREPSESVAEQGVWVPSRYSPTQGLAARAHFTLGCAPNVKPVQAGSDVVDLVACELTQAQLAAENCIESEQAFVRHYGGGRIGIYLKQPVFFKAMFTGHY